MLRTVILTAVLLTVGFSARGEQCSVNERSLYPWSMELDSKFEACRVRNGVKQCASQTSLNYGSVAVALNTATGGCGSKSSELTLDSNKLQGIMVLCNSNTEAGRFTLSETDCEQRKSKDGKYELFMCFQKGSEQVITLAFKSGTRSDGYILINSVGNPEVLSVNKMTCGEKRTKSAIKPRPPGPDEKPAETSI